MGIRNGLPLDCGAYETPKHPSSVVFSVRMSYRYRLINPFQAPCTCACPLSIQSTLSTPLDRDTGKVCLCIVLVRRGQNIGGWDRRVIESRDRMGIRRNDQVSKVVRTERLRLRWRCRRFPAMEAGGGEEV